MRSGGGRRLRVCFALPGFHRVRRGAELALEAVAERLAARADFEVTVIGGGRQHLGASYRFLHVPMVDRKTFARWPAIGPLRNEYRWEEATFLPGLWRAIRNLESDVSVTCSYPGTSWVLRLAGARNGMRHVFVTQNGDWPARRTNSEYRWFSCDGLVCTNPQYFQRHQPRWRSVLIPNGVEVSKFHPGSANRSRLGFPEGKTLVLMVSAFTRPKRVLEAVHTVARLGEEWALAVVGSGPLEAEFDMLATRLLPGRAVRLCVAPEQMPDVYRSSDVFLHMHLDEAFGNVFLEALSSGLPVVAHSGENTRWIFGTESLGVWPQCGPQREMPPLGAHATLVDTQNQEDVMSALRKAVNGKSDSSESKKARHAYAASRFALETSAQAYAEFLREVVSA